MHLHKWYQTLGLPSRSSTAAAALWTRAFRTLSAFSNRGIHSDVTDALIEEKKKINKHWLCTVHKSAEAPQTVLDTTNKLPLAIRCLPVMANPNSAAFARVTNKECIHPRLET
jgi:hypothetical protein